MNTGNTNHSSSQNLPRTKIPPWAINLRKYRKELGYTQTTFGEKFSVTPMAVSYWESGKVEPPIAVLVWLILASAPLKKIRDAARYASLFYEGDVDV